MTTRAEVREEFPRCEECAAARESWGECGDRDAMYTEIVRLRKIEAAALIVAGTFDEPTDCYPTRAVRLLRATLTPEAPNDG